MTVLNQAAKIQTLMDSKEPTALYEKNLLMLIVLCQIAVNVPASYFPSDF